MKKFLVTGILFSLAVFSFTSCDSDDDDTPWVEPEVKTTGVYILNSGSMGQNNSTLDYYDPTTNIYTGKIFENQNNNLKIGDTGNNMVIYGSKMYIFATNSNKIYITDLKGKLLKYEDNTDAIISPLNASNQPQKPREGVAYNGKVYVSLYDGYVAKIDTSSMNITQTVQVGTYPEQLAVAKNKLYVANSGYGDGTTVSEIDLNNFTVSKTINVEVNPNKVLSDKNGNVYIISWGKYSNDSQAILQKYDPSKDEFTVLGRKIASKGALNKDQSKLLLIAQVYDETWNSTTKFQTFDLNSNTLDEKSFITPPSDFDASKAYCITVDPTNGDIYVGLSDYKTNGSMYVFSSDGTYKTKLNTNGINPMGAYFVTGTK